MATRLSLILAAEDRARLDPFIHGGTGEHEVLQRWAHEHGVGPITSEAGALRVLLQAGVELLSDDVLDAGYAELAKTYADPELDVERRCARARYVRRTDSTM